jgi:hypothetical protein
MLNPLFSPVSVKFIQKKITMKTDLYTKVILTIIAISLSGIAIQLTSKNAYAQNSQFHFSQSGALIVTICNPNGNGYNNTCADIVNGGQLRTSPQ